MNDAYLQIEGIKGESTDEGHKDWIEVSKVQYSIYQPRAEVVSTGGGHTTGRADLVPITFKKLADISSPVLLQTCAVGRTISKASFEFLRADGNGNPVPYFRIELENLLIASVTPDSGDGGIITERVQLAFSKIQWKYVRQSVSLVTFAILSLPTPLSDKWRRALISLSVAFFAAVLVALSVFDNDIAYQTWMSIFAGVFIGTAVLTALVLRRWDGHP